MNHGYTAKLLDFPNRDPRKILTEALCDAVDEYIGRRSFQWRTNLLRVPSGFHLLRLWP